MGSRTSPGIDIRQEGLLVVSHLKTPPWQTCPLQHQFNFSGKHSATLPLLNEDCLFIINFSINFIYLHHFILCLSAAQSCSLFLMSTIVGTHLKLNELRQCGGYAQAQTGRRRNQAWFSQVRVRHSNHKPLCPT